MAYFLCVLNCRIFSVAAFTIGSYGQEQLIGFITAKVVYLHECDTVVGGGAC